MELTSTDGRVRGGRRMALQRVAGGLGVDDLLQSNLNLALWYRNSAAQALSASTWTNVTIDTAIYSCSHITYSANSFTTVTKGIYLISGNVGFGGSSSVDGYAALRFSVGGNKCGGQVNMIHNIGQQYSQNFHSSIVLPLAAGVQVYLQIWTSLGGLTTAAGTTDGCSLYMQRLG